MVLKKTPVIKIFVLPQESGPGGCGCCGPVGQSTEQIQALQYAIEDAFECQVDVYDITRRGDMPNVPKIFTLMSRSGVKALPVVTVNDEIVSTGKKWPEPVITALKNTYEQSGK